MRHFGPGSLTRRSFGFLVALGSVAFLSGLSGCGSGGPPPVVDSRKPGEESSLLSGVLYVPDASIVALRAAGIPDSAIIQRDIVRSVCVDELVTLVLEGITEEQLTELKESQFRAMVDPGNETVTARRNFEGNTGYLSIGPIQQVKGVKARVRFGSVERVDEANRLVFVKFRQPR